MEVKDNYLIRREEAKKYFLGFDQQEIINRWNLQADASYIYVVFLHRDYRIERKKGQVESSDDGFKTVREAGFEEVLSVFDLICHAETPPKASGIWSPVNGLKGRPRTIAVQEKRSGKEADFFDQDVEKFKKSCEEAGGTEVSMGDAGYEFRVFADLKVCLKFYRADEEFPAQITLLWDENALEYIHYETAFYIMGYLYKKIVRLMEE